MKLIALLLSGLCITNSLNAMSTSEIQRSADLVAIHVAPLQQTAGTISIQNGSQNFKNVRFSEQAPEKIMIPCSTPSAANSPKAYHEQVLLNDKSSSEQQIFAGAQNKTTQESKPVPIMNNWANMISSPSVQMQRDGQLQAPRAVVRPVDYCDCHNCENCCRDCCGYRYCCRYGCRQDTKCCCGGLCLLGAGGALIYGFVLCCFALNSDSCPNDIKALSASAPSSCLWQAGPFVCSDNNNIMIQGNSCYDEPTGSQLCDLPDKAAAAKGYSFGNSFCCSSIDAAEYNTTGQLIYPNIPACAANAQALSPIIDNILKKKN